MVLGESILDRVPQAFAVAKYVAEHRATVFISSLVPELERLCDWVGVLDLGTLVSQMPMVQLRNGIKRLRIRDPVGGLGDALFTVQSSNGYGPGISTSKRDSSSVSKPAGRGR